MSLSATDTPHQGDNTLTSQSVLVYRRLPHKQRLQGMNGISYFCRAHTHPPLVPPCYSVEHVTAWCIFFVVGTRDGNCPIFADVVFRCTAPYGSPLLRVGCYTFEESVFSATSKHTVLPPSSFVRTPFTLSDIRCEKSPHLHAFFTAMVGAFSHRVFMYCACLKYIYTLSWTQSQSAHTR